MIMRRVMEYGLVTQEDVAAWNLFLQHENEYQLDIGGLIERYEEADKMTEDLFSGTPYFVKVEEYCCNCTVSTLYKKLCN